MSDYKIQITDTETRALSCLMATPQLCPAATATGYWWPSNSRVLPTSAVVRLPTNYLIPLITLPTGHNRLTTELVRSQRWSSATYLSTGGNMAGWPYPSHQHGGKLSLQLWWHFVAAASAMYSGQQSWDRRGSAANQLLLSNHLAAHTPTSNQTASTQHYHKLY